MCPYPEYSSRYRDLYLTPLVWIVHNVTVTSRYRMVIICEAGLHVYYFFVCSSLLPRTSVVGVIGSLVISSQGWRSLMLLVGSVSLAWVLGLCAFSTRYKKTHYNLSNGAQLVSGTDPKLAAQPLSLVSFCIGSDVPWKALLTQAPVL